MLGKYLYNAKKCPPFFSFPRVREVSAIGTCVQLGLCVCCEAGSVPALRRNQSAHEPRSHRSGAAGVAGSGGQQPLPRRGRFLVLCPELIPQSSEVLSLTMKPNNLCTKQKNLLLLMSSLSDSPRVNWLLWPFFYFIESQNGLGCKGSSSSNPPATDRDIFH